MAKKPAADLDDFLMAMWIHTKRDLFFVPPNGIVHNRGSKQSDNPASMVESAPGGHKHAGFKVSVLGAGILRSHNY